MQMYASQWLTVELVERVYDFYDNNVVIFYLSSFKFLPQ